ncbi:MAG TPA: carboxypeptidase-like regulatory domain-containing protein [Thermoanaerobaculia bacterium]
MNFLLAALVTVSSLVIDSTGGPLPGVTVTLSNGTLTRTAVTDAGGRYTFEGVREGTYDFRHELAGFEPAVQRAHTGAVAPQVLEMREGAEAITIACGPRCGEEAPAAPYDMPRCADRDLNETLLEAAAAGDRSARALLRTRYAHAVSFDERHQIGAALLDDGDVWNELFARASIFLRFPRVGHRYSPEFLQWCDANGHAPEIWSASHDALMAIAKDRRARDLLRRALQSHDEEAVWTGLLGMVELRDRSSLALIEDTLRRFPDQASMMALALVSFGSRDADAIAMKFISDDLRAEYERARDEQR